MPARISRKLQSASAGGDAGPKPVAIVTAVLRVFVVLGVWAAAVFVFQPFGHREWTFTTVAVMFMGLLLGLRTWLWRSADAQSRVKRILGHPVAVSTGVLAAALACWLGLIVWSACKRGGSLPPAKTNPDAIRVVTWNILLGKDRGLPWNQHGWPVRKSALETALAGTNADILCVQEALEGQLRFLESRLPGHRRVGVGRDDGRSAGEHSAVFFDMTRFEEAGGGTFWLEEPADRPPERLILGPKRICTWVRLRDRRTGRWIRVYNTHLYLTEKARVEAVRLILARMSSGDPTDALLLAGDFNATSRDRSRRLLSEAGLFSSAALAGKIRETPTYQFYGIPTRSLDEILVDRRWRVLDHRVLDVKPDNTFPSDHFGVMADLLSDIAIQSGDDQVTRRKNRSGRAQPLDRKTGK